MGMQLYQMLLKIKKLGPQTIDRNDEFIEWKEKWDSRFVNLSQVAKVAATMSFLKGYNAMNRKLRNQKGSQHPRQFPSVSKKKDEISLLDAGIVEKFFKKYSEYINKRDPMSLNKVVEGSNMHVSLAKSVQKVCGR